MGHEYVELKNTAAAVDAYRHAVDIDPKDYRAWYGLGQTYEILTMCAPRAEITPRSRLTSSLGEVDFVTAGTFRIGTSTLGSITARPRRSVLTTHGCGARWPAATSGSDGRRRPSPASR